MKNICSIYVLDAMTPARIKSPCAREAPENPLPSYSVDTYSMPLDEAWRTREAIYKGTFLFEKADSPGGGARMRSGVTFLEDLVVATFQGEAHVITRTADLITASSTPVLKVRIYTHGECRLVQGEAEAKMGPGAIHFIDHDRPHRQIGTEMKHMTLGIPHHAVGYDPLVHPAYFSVPIDSPRGRMLKAGLCTVFEEVRRLDQSEAAGMAAAIKGLVRGVILGGVGPEASDDNRQSRLAAMKAFIDQNLAEPELGIDMLLEKFGASRATVYRDFASEGGLQNFILSRRLHRAYRVLSEAVPTRGAVLAVAESCGFLTLAHFSRSFREHFGERPSDILGQWQTWTHDPAQMDGGVAAQQLSGPAAALQWSYNRFK